MTWTKSLTGLSEYVFLRPRFGGTLAKTSQQLSFSGALFGYYHSGPAFGASSHTWDRQIVRCHTTASTREPLPQHLDLASCALTSKKSFSDITLSLAVSSLDICLGTGMTAPGLSGEGLTRRRRSLRRSRATGDGLRVSN